MEELLIEEVRSYEFLYNLQSKEYRDQKKRQEAWEEIGKTLNKSWQECRDTWTKLRNAFTNALKRRKTTNGQAAKKIAKWRFEDQMCFLSPYMEPRLSHCSFELQNESTFKSQVQETNRNSDDLQLEDEDNVNGDPSINIMHNKSELRSLRTSNNIPKSRKQIEKSMTEIVEIMKRNNRLRSRIIRPPESTAAAQNNTHNDEIELFFLSLAKTVKKLPENEQVRLKMTISNIVFEAELRNMCSEAPQLTRRIVSEVGSPIMMPQSSPAQTSSTNSGSNHLSDTQENSCSNLPHLHSNDTFFTTL